MSEDSARHVIESGGRLGLLLKLFGWADIVAGIMGLLSIVVLMDKQLLVGVLKISD